MTQYVILEQSAGSTLTWTEIARVEAASDRQAISKHLEDDDTEGGVFVAIPVRSFRVRKVAAKKKLSFS